jgi:hypothetical protein
MSATKVLLARFEVDAEFIIPNGMDLDDETQVSDYFVRYTTLYITLVTGEEIEIQGGEDIMIMADPCGFMETPTSTKLIDCCNEGNRCDWHEE